MNSSRLGTDPLRTTCATASPAARIVGNIAATVRGAAAAGINATVTSVMTPRVPSDPTSSPSRS